MPFPECEPGYLAARAVLRGRRPPPVRSARVLEIGCASGGNIIPLAANYPECTILGIDLSHDHIASGVSFLAKTNLTNIELRQADIATFTHEGEPFDYIICHGVLSWIPPSIRHHVYRICAEYLSPDGLAYISYNTAPGWHRRHAVRDICHLTRDRRLPPSVQVKNAREILAAYRTSSDTKTIYGKMLIAEIESCLSMSDSHFYGEFFPDTNAAITVSSFREEVSDHGLDYLFDATFGDEGAKKKFKQAAENQHLFALESGKDSLQVADIITGRMFRRSVICRGNRGDGLLSLEDKLKALCFRGELAPEMRSDGAIVLKKGEAQLATNDPVSIEAFKYLYAECETSFSFDQLCEYVRQKRQSLNDAEKRRLGDALIYAAEAAFIGISVESNCVSADVNYPALWSLARVELENGREWVSTQFHMPVRLDESARKFALSLDGHKTLRALEELHPGLSGDGIKGAVERFKRSGLLVR